MNRKTVIKIFFGLIPWINPECATDLFREFKEGNKYNTKNKNISSNGSIH